MERPARQQITPAMIKEYVARFEWFREPAKQGYLATALDRLAHTLNLLATLPHPKGVRVLEIGGIPYFMTALMAHFLGYEVDVANEPTWDRGPEGNRDVLVRDDGARLEVAYEAFDIEYDPWPWADDTFDIVVYCEVIEHLVYDPTHTLVEAHRVLKKGTGTLLLSTPNALAYPYILQLLRGRNPYPPYSGYNAHARHHRLFSPDELAHLCREIGFEVSTVYSTFDAGYPRPPRLDRLVHLLVARGRMRSRLDVIYLLGTPVGTATYAYPSTEPHPIYADVHGYAFHHCRSGVVRMRDNATQLVEGFYPMEAWGEGVRWTGRFARVVLRNSGERELRVVCCTGPREGEKPVRVSVEATDGQQVASGSYDLRLGEWEDIHLDLPADLGEQVTVAITVDDVFIPGQIDPTSGDNRELGVAVREVALV